MEILSNAAMVNRLKHAQTTSAELTNRLVDIKKEMDRRVLWTRKLACICASLPESVSLTSIVQKAGRGTASAEPTFVINGSVPVSPVKDREAIITFLENLRQKGKEEFASVTLQKVSEQAPSAAVEKEEQKGRERSFIIECRIRPSSR